MKIVSFKEKMLTAVRTAVALVLAVIMFMFFLPVGIVPEPETDDDNGKVVRLLPVAENYSDRNDASVKKIGAGHSAYYAFDLEKFVGEDADELNSVRIRFVFLCGSGGIDNRINVNLLHDGTFPERAVVGGGEQLLEKKISEIRPYTTGADDSVCEIDVTALAAERIARGKSDLKIRLSSESENPVCIADTGYDDPMYRPCIKVATGEKSDTDSQSLRRAQLTDAVYVSENSPDKSGKELTTDNALRAGRGNEAYLKFDLDENAVDGTVYSADLSLDMLNNSESRVRIYCINNNEWSSESISYNMRPRGDESTAFTPLSAPIKGDGRVSFDVTQAVCEARKMKISTLTFRIVCDEAVTFSAADDEKYAPRLYLRASDNEDVVCAAEAALNALGTNRASFVTMKLEQNYTDANGNGASIRWSEYSAEGERVTSERISAVGEITRPKWFEGDEEIIAVADIRSGRYRTRRQYDLVVPAETAPDYSGYEFGNYIDIGTEKSEAAQKFDCIKTSGTRRRWTDGRMFTYRVPERGGIMVLNLACMPDRTNYLTLKLWVGDKKLNNDFAVESSDGGHRVVFETPMDSEATGGGFIYVTRALPEELTKGKTHISLKLSYDKASEAEEYEVRGLYAAYLTQNVYFDPKSFAGQGEKSISEPLFGESAMSKFIENIRTFFMSAFEEIDSGTEDVQEQMVSAEPETGNIAFAGPDANIAFSIDAQGGKALVYQKLEYYDRASYDCPVEFADGVTVVDYGDCKLAWNKTNETKVLPHEGLELSGAYREAMSGSYYTFTEGEQMMDSSVLPEDEVVLNGCDIRIEAGDAILLMHVSDPMHNPDWRVNRINGRSLAQLEFGSNEMIESIAVKSVGDISDNAERLTVAVAVYENERIVALGRDTTAVTGSIDVYTLDMSEFEIFMKKGRTMRIFVYDDTEKLTELSPKLELP